jgi:LPS O-antigen subunit length determinant protein (WzzB/FepE family)
MQEIDNNNNLNNHDDEIDLRELYNVLLQGKWIIISITTFISIIAVIYSLLLPNIYQSRALLAPVYSSSVNGSLGGYSGLVGLAGINLPSGSDQDNSFKAIQKISSLSFFEDNILENIYLPDLMAIKSWNPDTNTMIYDEDIYNSKTNTWIKDDSGEQQLIPSAQSSFGVFIGNHLSLTQDKKSGFLTLLIKHQSPFIAKQWAELVVNEINNFYRKKDKSESEKAASYLNQQILTTDLSEIKQVLAQLLQEETKKLALIEANQYYVFEYIDPPAIMERKSEPRRALICILSALLSGILSVVLVLTRHYVLKEKI